MAGSREKAPSPPIRTPRGARRYRLGELDFARSALLKRRQGQGRKRTKRTPTACLPSFLLGRPLPPSPPSPASLYTSHISSLSFTKLETPFLSHSIQIQFSRISCAFPICLSKEQLCFCFYSMGIPALSLAWLGGGVEWGRGLGVGRGRVETVGGGQEQDSEL